jgi:hypothetical protein
MDKPCYTCEKGTVRVTNLRGRPFDYRDEIGLIFDADLEAPVCDHCGELYLSGALTQQFSDTLEQLRLARKREVAQHFVRTVETRYPLVPRSLWEDTLGISHGYLSRLASGARVPETSLAILLEGFAKEPETALRMFSLAGHLPHELSELLGVATNPKQRQIA